MLVSFDVAIAIAIAIGIAQTQRLDTSRNGLLQVATTRYVGKL